MHGVAPQVLANRAQLAERFRRARPFPHLVIDSFFEDAFCQALMDEFPPFERGSDVDDNGRPGLKSTVANIRSLGGAYAAADALFRSPDFAGMIGDITGIPRLLYDPQYVGGGTHENLPGQDLDPHIDFNFHPDEPWHRRLNLIVYLNPEWKDEWGGSLDLYEDPWTAEGQRRPVRVLPLANRAVLFETSERSWHGFETIREPENHERRSRRSLAIYMYTEERPSEETAPSHSTIYVDRRPSFAFGNTLTFEQHRELAVMLFRRQEHVERLRQRDRALTAENISRLLELLASGAPLGARESGLLHRMLEGEDALLKALYEREKELSRDRATLAEALAARTRSELHAFGKARLTLPVWGYYMDHWAAPSLEMELSASDRATALTFHGDLPDMYPRGQHVECVLGDAVHSRDFAPGPFEWSVPVSIGAGERLRVSLRAREVARPIRDVPGSTDDRELAYRLLAVELE